MKILYIVLLILGLASLGTYLVITEHYGWAWIPFVLAASVSYKSEKENKEQDEH